MLDRLADHFAVLPSRDRALSPGQFLFHCGDPVMNVHWVRHGLIHLQRFTKDGVASVMQRAATGSLIAEASIFSDRYHCDAVAIEPVEIRQYALADVHRALRETPGFAVVLSQQLAHEVMRLRSRSEIAALRTVEARLDAWLALNDHQLPDRGKRVQLAREIGVSSEALYRELARRQSYCCPKAR